MSKSDPPVLCAGTNPNETESVDGGEDTAAGIYFWKFCKINYWEHGHITPSYLCICRYPLCVFHSFRYPLLHLHRACFVFDYFQKCEKQGPRHLFCLSKLIVMLQICFDTIALSSVVNVINVTTPKNRGAKSETPDAISGT